MRRVVVTGLGVLSPLGNTVESTWQGIVAGQSGIGPIESLDPSAYTTHFGGAIRDFDITGYMPAKDARRMDLFIQYGVAAGMQPTIL